MSQGNRLLEPYLNNTHPYTFIRMGRRMGKSSFILEWMFHHVKSGKHGLVLANFHEQVKLLFEIAVETYADQISIYSMSGSSGKIYLKDGGLISFTKPSLNIRGLHFDYLAYDEAGLCRRGFERGEERYPKEFLFESVPPAGKQLFMSTVYQPGSIMYEMAESESIKQKSVMKEFSYLDGLDLHILDTQFIKEALNSYGLEGFRKEFGPWNEFKQENQDFVSMMKKIEEYY